MWTALATVLSVGVAAPAAAKRKPKGPTQVVPPKKGANKEDPKDLSRGGQRRGVTEIVLGAIAGGAAVALVGRGVWEIFEGRRVRRECATEFVDTACNRPNPGNGGFIAAGLSFGLVVPFSVASGLLLYRGTKINRAYKAWKKSQGSVSMAVGPRSAGVGLTLRF